MTKKRKKIAIGNFKSITCAFCKGKGRDPFGILSKLSNCQVCIGRGTVQVVEPVEICPACAGTGIYKHHRLPCAVCKGKGQLHRISGKDRTYECKPENKEMLDIETGLPCISAYDLGLNPAKRDRPIATSDLGSIKKGRKKY